MSDTATLPASNGVIDLPDKPISKFNLRAQILSADDAKFEDVEVPEWGDVTVRVVSMSGKERARMLKAAMDDDDRVDLERMYPLVIIATAHERTEAVDGVTGATVYTTGARVFSPEDADALNERNGAALERLANAGMRLSGLQARSQEEAGKRSS